MSIEPAALTPAQEAQVALVVEQWGEPFRTLALNPRLRFDGDAIVITLWKAVTVTGEDVSELRLREPELDDLQKMEGAKGDISSARKLLVATCSITEREVGKLGLRDLTMAMKLVEAFSGAVPATGSKS